MPVEIAIASANRQASRTNTEWRALLIHRPLLLALGTPGPATQAGIVSFDHECAYPSAPSVFSKPYDTGHMNVCIRHRPRAPLYSARNSVFEKVRLVTRMHRAVDKVDYQMLERPHMLSTCKLS